MNIIEILENRQKVHGVFQHNASISQELKHIIRPLTDDRLSVIHKEALDMISSKIARILCGDADHPDHWDDIAGYATLVSSFLKSQDS